MACREKPFWMACSWEIVEGWVGARTNELLPTRTVDYGRYRAAVLQTDEMSCALEKGQTGGNLSRFFE